MRGIFRRAVGSLENITESLFACSLKLDMGDKTTTFKTVVDFEFALASRTEFPVNRCTDLMRLSAEEVRRVAINIGQVEKRLAEVLAASLEEPGSIGRRMRVLEIKLFSQDHEWRTIINTLNKQGPRFDDFKRVALVKYMQYLDSRHKVLKNIYLEMKRRHVEAPVESEPAADLYPKETPIFNLSPRGASALPAIQYRQLPKGETVVVRLPQDQEVDLMLSKYKFKLLRGRRIYLVDDRGTRYGLRAGKSIMGRQAGNDVVIDRVYRGVSRKHLIVEPLSENAARLTDLSLHGTFVPYPYWTIPANQSCVGAGGGGTGRGSLAFRK